MAGQRRITSSYGFRVIGSPAVDTAHPRAGENPAQDVRSKAGPIFDRIG